MRAYDETYLDDAMNNLGDMFDYAVNDCGFDAEDFFGHFIISGVAEAFERGNPKYVAGLSGPELASEVIYRTFSSRPDTPSAENIDKSPEYWQAGSSRIISGKPYAAFPICEETVLPWNAYFLFIRHYMKRIYPNSFLSPIKLSTKILHRELVIYNESAKRAVRRKKSWLRPPEWLYEWYSFMSKENKI